MLSFSINNILFPASVSSQGLEFFLAWRQEPTHHCSELSRRPYEPLATVCSSSRQFRLFYHVPQNSSNLYPQPGCTEISTFLGIYYSSIPLLGTKICIGFVLLCNKLLQMSWLKTISLILSVSAGQKSRHCMTRFSTPSLTRLKSRYQQGCIAAFLLGGSGGRISSQTHPGFSLL